MFLQPFLPCIPLSIKTKNNAAVDLILETLDTINSNFIVVNAPSPKKSANKFPCSSCLIEYGITESTYNEIIRDKYFVVNNINKSISVKEATEQIEKGVNQTKSKYIKLEILDKNNLPNNKMTIELCKECNTYYPDLKIMPLLFPNTDDLNEIISLDCYMIRLITGRIGEFTGIIFKQSLENFIPHLNTKIILEGGIKDTKSLLEAFSLGADYVLATSVFQNNDWVSIAKQFMDASLNFKSIKAPNT